VPVDYSSGFWLEGPIGNNALSYDRRGPAPRLWVPGLISGTINDVKPGDQVVFEEFDDEGALRSCRGLAHLVRTTVAGIPTVVVDNHNHAFYFWYEAYRNGQLLPGATLVHVDQHRDTRVPDRLYDGSTLEDAFDYTNRHLNVGNFILPAQQAGIIGATQMVTGDAALDDLMFASHPNKILDLDLDFFAPEMSYIDEARVQRFVEAQLATTALITVATSPFFIDQARAIEVLHRLLGKSATIRRPN
jgi:hypothetical protein